MNKDSILGFIRHLLTFGGGFLVAKDLIPADALDQVVAALITIVGVSWSAVDKQGRE
jgi:hypothetical protein